MPAEHFDVVIVGAGLSGIGAGVHLQTHSPGKTFALLEARECIGGTWDLFRYPGIRSDSDMYTLGYSFRPWKDAKAIADGASILSYIRQTAKDHGIDGHIRFNHRMTRAQWSTADSTWTVEAERGPSRETACFTCNFLFMCSGYYSYAEGFTPEFPGVERFKGEIVHPQKWNDTVDYAGKRVVIIGSGATAVTLAPALTDKAAAGVIGKPPGSPALAPGAAHVTMLQRSPSYILSLPSQDVIANFLRRILPAKLAYAITRWKNVMLAMLIFWLSRHKPEWVKRLVRKGVRAELGSDYDMRHFTPPYNPWDQRLCLVPDADLFKTIREGRVTMVTDHIETFTEKGIKLKSGAELEADLIVSATGLKLQLLGGAQLTVDGRAMDSGKSTVYKGMMLSDVPNFAFAVGYTNASWTLKVDLVSQYVCRLINHMDKRGYRQCMPRVKGDVGKEPLIDFSSGYIQRALDFLPKQGNRTPWKLYQNYALDLVTLRLGALEDGAMEFSSPARLAKAA